MVFCEQNHISQLRDLPTPFIICMYFFDQTHSCGCAEESPITLSASSDGWTGTRDES